MAQSKPQRSTEDIIHQLDAMEKASRRSWPFIAIGILAIIGSLYYSVIRLHQIQSDLKTTRTELAQVEDEIVIANQKKAELKAETEAAEKRLAEIHQHMQEITEELQNLQTAPRQTSTRTRPLKLTAITEMAERTTASIQRLQVELTTAKQASNNSRVFFHVRDEQARTAAKELAGTLSQKVEGIELVKGGPETSELRYFHKTDQDGAEALAAELAKSGLKVESKYVTPRNRVRPETYEVWIAKPSTRKK